jgi:hypothetical protein
MALVTMLVPAELRRERLRLAEPRELATLPFRSLIKAVCNVVWGAAIESPPTGTDDIPETVI